MGIFFGALLQVNAPMSIGSNFHQGLVSGTWRFGPAMRALSRKLISADTRGFEVFVQQQRNESKQANDFMKR
jgi:hypothetical protein